MQKTDRQEILGRLPMISQHRNASSLAFSRPSARTLDSNSDCAIAIAIPQEAAKKSHKRDMMHSDSIIQAYTGL